MNDNKDKFARVKSIVESKDELNHEDLAVFIDYLKELFIHSAVKVEHIYTDDTFDMTYTTYPDFKITINDKHFLENSKNNDILNKTFNFFKSFIHEFVHMRREQTWKKDTNEYINFTTEMIIVGNYCKEKGFNFYAKNQAYSLVELEAELISAQIMMSYIKSGQWEIFNSDEFIKQLKNQIIRNELLNLIKPVRYIDKDYPLYDTAMIDILLKIYQEDPSKIKRFELLGEIINPEIDIVDMVFNYGENHYDYLRYLIIYLAEERLFMLPKIQSKMSSMDHDDKVKFVSILSEIKQHEITTRDNIVFYSQYIDEVVEPNAIAFFKDQSQKNIKLRNMRVNYLDEFAKLANIKPHIQQ